MFTSILHIASGSAGAEETVQGIAQLGIDPVQIVLQAATFLVLFFILNKYGLNKIVAVLKDRRQRIDESLSNADELELEKERVEKKNQEILSKAREKADKIIAQSQEERASLLDEAQSRAMEQADKIVERAKVQASTEADKAREQLKAELLDLVAMATENVLEEKIDSSKDKLLIEKSLSQGVNS